MQGKFVVEQKDILSLLVSMQPICNKRTTLDITESIMFQIAPKELTLKATDLEVSLQSSMNIESDFLENFEFLISGKRIFELVKEMEGQIEFKFDKNQLHLKSFGVELSLNIKPAEDFPPFPERIENLMQLNSSYFLEMLGKAFIFTLRRAPERGEPRSGTQTGLSMGPSGVISAPHTGSAPG